MYSVLYRCKGDRAYRPYADGLSGSQLFSYVGTLALLAEVRDIRIIQKSSPFKLYQL